MGAVATTVDGIPNRDSPDTRATLAACYHKRIIRTYRPPVEEPITPIAPVRVIVAGGRRITGEPAGAGNPPDEQILGFLATASWGPSVPNKVRTGPVGKRDPASAERDPASAKRDPESRSIGNPSIGRNRKAIGDCVIKAGRV